MMISTQKKQRQIFENFVTNLNMHSASWPKTKHQNSQHNVLIQTWNNPGKMSYALTIPVNNIDTIPDRPRPSASMYLKNYIVYTDLHHEWKKIRKHKLIEKWSVKVKISYEKYGKRTKRQLSKFWRLDRIIKFYWLVYFTCNVNHQTINIWKKTDIWYLLVNIQACILK